MNYQSDNRRHVVDCDQQVFQQTFDLDENLEALEICVPTIKFDRVYIF